MTGRLDRDELISLLETLGSDSDAEVLAAARALDGKVGDADTAWDALLARNIGEDTGDDADHDSGTDGEDAAPAAASAELPSDEAAKNAETLALIDTLLGRSGQSDAFREELEGYKADIADGEMTDGDHHYVRALYKRLSG